MRVAVTDRVGLSAMLREVIDRDFEGSLKSAARTVGLSQASLYRLVEGKAPRKGLPRQLSVSEITLDVFARLSTLLSSRSQDAGRFFMTRSGRQSFDAYNEWLAWEIVRLREGIPGEGQIESRSPDSDWPGRSKEFMKLVARVCNDAPSVATFIRRGLNVGVSAGTRLESLLLALGGKDGPSGKAAYRGITPYRYELALYRILGPLLDARATGWIERRDVELTKQEFRAFVEAGWKRESILLERTGDFRRAQRVRDPSLNAKLAKALGYPLV